MSSPFKVSAAAAAATVAVGFAVAGSVATANDAYSPPRTPWGDPDIQGIYTNVDENGTPLERPREFEGMTLDDFDSAAMARLRAERQARAAQGAVGIGGTADENTGAGPPHWYEHLEAENSQPWLIFDPPDGRVPAISDEGRVRQQRQAARQATYFQTAHHFANRSFYDRCITRGLPGSMMPAIYGNAYDITQGPGWVAIRYEMIHETRVIPLDGRPHVASGIRMHMGDARGHWEGDTLVVVTRNFREETAYRAASEDLTITERFIPIDENTLRWEVHFDDARTWERPWAFTMPLKRDPFQEIFEYACHEGNLGLENMLRIGQLEREAAAAEGR
jgi:hypothetical protein